MLTDTSGSIMTTGFPARVRAALTSTNPVTNGTVALDRLRGKILRSVEAASFQSIKGDYNQCSETPPKAIKKRPGGSGARASACGMAPVEEDGLAGHEVRGGRGQVDGQGADLLGPADPSGRNVTYKTLSDPLVPPGRRRHLRVEPAGRDAVHLDVVARPFHAQGPREGDDRPFGGRVDGVPGQADRSEHGRNVDDLPRPLGDEVWCRGPAAVNDAEQVDVHQEAPFLRRPLDQRLDPGQTRVVHDDVEPAQGL